MFEFANHDSRIYFPPPCDELNSHYRIPNVLNIHKFTSIISAVDLKKENSGQIFPTNRDLIEIRNRFAGRTKEQKWWLE